MSNDNRHNIDGWDPKNIPVVITCVIIGIVAIIVMLATIANARPPWDENPAQTSQVQQTNTPPKPVSNINSNTAPEQNVIHIPSKYTSAYDTNNDLVGWIDIPDTKINSPLVQTTDNTKYLKTDFDGTPKEYGDAIFVDCRTDLSENQNPIIYGHNLLSGESFAQLCKYWPWFDDYDGTTVFAERNPIIRYEDFYDDGRPEYLIFAAAYVTADTTDPYYLDVADYIDIKSKEEFKTKMTKVLDRSAIYNNSVDLEYGDRILILSTCLELLGKDKDTRLLVFARQARNDENLANYRPRFEINEEPLYFQGYYDIMGGEWIPGGKKWNPDILKD